MVLFSLVCSICILLVQGQGDLRAGWEDGGTTPEEAFNKCSALVSKSLRTSVKQSKWRLLSSNPGEETVNKLNVECAIDNVNWKWLGDFQIYVEVYLDETNYLPTSLELSNRNDREGIFASFTKPAGGWRTGWNTIRIPLTDRNIKHGSITDWKNLVHFQVYRGGKSTPDRDSVGNKIYFRNFWFLSMSDKINTITTTTTTTTAHTTSTLPDCSVPLISWLPMSVEDNKYFVLDKVEGEREGFHGNDLSCAVDADAWAFKGNFELQGDVWIEDARFFPTTIELTNENNAEGIMTSFLNSYPRPQWKSKTWHSLKIPLSRKNLRHANETRWEDMTRLEFYRNRVKYDSSMGNIRIILRHFNFVKVGDEEPHSDNEHVCTKEIAPTLKWKIVRGKDYLFNDYQINSKFSDNPFDMSCAVDANTNTFTADYEISFDVWCEDERSFPTKFELMNVNDRQGIMTDFPEPEGGWKLQTWQRLFIPISNKNVYHGSTTDWSSLKHFQIYFNKDKGVDEETTVGKTILMRNIWLIGSGSYDPPTTTTTTTDPQATLAPLPSCSFNVVNWFYHPVGSSKHNIMYTYTKEEDAFTFDLSCAIDSQSWTLADTFEWQADIWITDPRYRPAQIELTNQNNQEGIMSTLDNAVPSPKDWIVGGWTKVRLALNDSNVHQAESTDWLRMTRLELYRTGIDYLDEDPDFVENTMIKIRNLNLVRVADSTTITTTAPLTTVTTLTTTTVSTTTVTTTTATRTTTTAVSCNAGEYRVSGENTCTGCPDGQYRPESSHSLTECALQSSCADEEFESVAATPSSNVRCSSSKPCRAGVTWQSQPPKAGSTERECTPITACAQGQYIQVDATSSSDQICAPCDATEKALAGGVCTTTSTTTMTTTTVTTTTKTTTSKAAEADASNAAAKGAGSPAASGKGGNTTAIIVVVAILVLVVVIAAAVIVKRRGSSGPQATVSFENPAYGDAMFAGASAGSNGAGAPAAADTGGYMDVSPNAGGGGGGGTSGYMDVGPGDFASGDDGLSEEDV